jgi:hypothetical protein
MQSRTALITANTALKNSKTKERRNTIMLKAGSRVRYNRKDNAEDIETGFYPPIGTCGTVVRAYPKDIEVKWDKGTKGDGIWWCKPTDVVEVEFSLKDLIEEKVDEIFIAYQNAHEINNGDIEPMDALKLDHIEEMLKEHIEYVCAKQKEVTQ